MSDEQEKQDEQQLAQQASEAKPEGQGQATVLGLRRWVMMAFVCLGFLLLWTFDKLIVGGWSKFAEPNSLLASLGAALLALVATIRVYKHPTIHRLSYEVAGELSKVTWPSREETQVSTGVVIVTSVIAAAILGVFDFVWSTLTDYIY